MRRRDFLGVLGGAAAAWPVVARGQQPEQMRSVGALIGATADDPDAQARTAAFVQALRQLGWTDGRNVRIDIRWAAGDADDIRRHAVELVALAPDVILAGGSSSVAPLLRATRAVPIVFAFVADPVGSGFVDSLSRPGGNATGFMSAEYSTSGKWLELLKEIAPGVTRAAVLRDAAITSGIGQFAVIQSVAPSVGIEVSPVNVREASEIERAVTAFARSPNGGLIVTGSALAGIHRDLIYTLVARHKLPAVYSESDLRHRRWPDLLWVRLCRPVPARGRLRRSHPQGREAGRPPRASADQICADDQPQGRQGARPHCFADAARACR